MFLAPEDEQAFEHDLKRAVPGIRFVDDQHWETRVPPFKESLSLCVSLVYLWDSAARASLPSVSRPSGGFLRPTSGIVIQYLRCRRKPGELHSGEFTTIVKKEDEAMVEFVKRTFKILKAIGHKSLTSFDSQTGEQRTKGNTDYIVGPGAAALSKAGTRLHYVGVTHYFYRVD